MNMRTQQVLLNSATMFRSGILTLYPGRPRRNETVNIMSGFKTTFGAEMQRELPDMMSASKWEGDHGKVDVGREVA